MAQRPSSERSHLRAVQGERVGAAQPGQPTPDQEFSEGSTPQQVWDIVRKSTDVIVALREENSILRNEIASLRKSENVLQERLKDLLDRIDQVESTRQFNASESVIDAPRRVERRSDETSNTSGVEQRGSRTTTITITIQDDCRSDMERRVSDLVHSLVEELRRGI